MAGAQEATADIWRPSYHTGLREVRQFRTPDGKRVDVICGRAENPVVSLKRFWATVVMNFLRPNGGVCGFPRDTLRGRGIVRAVQTDRDERAAAKYRERGFTLREEGPDDSEIWRGCLTFGGEMVLVEEFGNGDETESALLPIVRDEDRWVIAPDWPVRKGK